MDIHSSRFSSYAEQRDFHRMIIDAPMTYQISGEEGVYKGLTKNLSPAGLCFIAEAPLDPHTLLSVTILCPNNDFKAYVETIWLKPQEDSYLIGGRITRHLSA